MPVHFPKIIDVDLSKSRYGIEGGNFYFRLDKAVEDRWKQAFRDAVDQERADCFIGNQPMLHDDEWIVAYSTIEGENDLNTVLRHLKHAIAVANQELGRVVEAENQDQARKETARRELEQKVKTIVGKLDLS